MDILNERRLSIPALAKRENISVGCGWRWVLYGVRGGIRLESCLIGGKRFTSEEAIERFISRINAEPGTTPTTRTVRQREADVRRAEVEVLGASK
jgi:hypothetical protein